MNDPKNEHPDMLELAQRIAEHLPGWTAVPEDGRWMAYLTHPDGPKLALRHDKGRLNVMGTWPFSHGEHFYPRDKSADISCALSRGPLAIAKDIERRLLPEYLPLWAEQDSRRRDVEKSNQKAEALMCRLEELLGHAHRDHSRHGRNDTMHMYHGDFTFAVRRYGSVKIEVTTSDPEKVLRIAELARTFEAED